MANEVVTAQTDDGVIVAFIRSGRIRLGEDGVFLDLPTVDGASVGLPANTLHIDPSTGRLRRTT